jgi:creatinine amidohydrolase
MAGRPYVLRETNWREVQQTRYEVALLPWGATEAHNYHLPYGTDIYEAEAVAIEAARIAWQAGSKVVVLPTVPFGVNTGQLDISLTINMNPSTQLTVLRDIVTSLESQNVPRLVIVNGHGGNEFKPMIRELQPRGKVLIATINWWSIVEHGRYFESAGDHAGELETSVMLHLHPELVLPLDQAGTGATHAYTVRALREGWAWTPREWTRATADTGVGNPAHANVDKGSGFFAAVSQKIADFLAELARTPLDDLYER